MGPSLLPRDPLEVRTWDRGKLTASIYHVVLHEGTPTCWWTRTSWGTLDPSPPLSISSLEKARISYFGFLLPLPSSKRLLCELILKSFFILGVEKLPHFSPLKYPDCFPPSETWSQGLCSSPYGSSEWHQVVGPKPTTLRMVDRTPEVGVLEWTQHWEVGPLPGSMYKDGSLAFLLPKYCSFPSVHFFLITPIISSSDHWKISVTSFFVSSLGWLFPTNS